MPDEKEQPIIVESQGVPAHDQIDEREVYQRAVAEFRRTLQIEEMRANQFVAFNRGPVCIVFLGDQHFGDPGTDIERAFTEARIIRNTPGMYAWTLGDMLNQFVIGNLRRARDKARLSIGDEWALVRLYLRILAPKLLGSVAGNHENWSDLLIGIDYFRDTLAQIRPDCIYAAHDCRVKFIVGKARFPARIRHKWRGFSMYNPTHGIERGEKFDTHDFVLGVGAHTHASGVARDFNVGGENGLAVLVGSYKRHDAYADSSGFPRPNRSTAVAVIFDDETASMTGIANLDMAARFMERVYEQSD